MSKKLKSCALLKWTIFLEAFVAPGFFFYGSNKENFSYSTGDSLSMSDEIFVAPPAISFHHLGGGPAPIHRVGGQYILSVGGPR